MTSRHPWLLAALTLITLPAFSASVAAQTVESAPTNCCVEIYWVGWELGRLGSIASYTTAAYRQEASLHMQRLSTTLQAANQSCCRFCEAWSEWEEIQSGIQATAKDLLGSSAGDEMETRRAFQQWTEVRATHLLEGLNRCDLEEGMPCKWLDLVDCARGYFRLGEQLGHAMRAFSAAGDAIEPGLVQNRSARQHGLERLERAVDLMTALRADGPAPGSAEPTARCDYRWETEPRAARLLSEVLREPGLYTDAQLAGKAAEAHRLIVRLLVDGQPDLGISPCPIGGAHHHEDCERAEEHGHLVPADQGN